MKKVLLLTFIIFSVSFAVVPDEPLITASEIDIITGEKWKGNLIRYYPHREEVKSLVELNILKLDDEGTKYLFSFEYTNEPEANSLDTMIIRDNGRVFGNETLVGKFVFDDESAMRFTTQGPGIEDDKPVTFQHIYQFSPVKLTIKKRIKYDSEDIFWPKNKFVFER